MYVISHPRTFSPTLTITYPSVWYQSLLQHAAVFRLAKRKKEKKTPPQSWLGRLSLDNPSCERWVGGLSCDDESSQHARTRPQDRIDFVSLTATTPVHALVLVCETEQCVSHSRQITAKPCAGTCLGHVLRGHQNSLAETLHRTGRARRALTHLVSPLGSS